MPIRKRNEFLDAGDTDEDDNLDSGHEDARDSRTAGLKSRDRKRQKLTTTGSEHDDESAFDGSDNDSTKVAGSKHDVSLKDIPMASSTTKRTLLTKTSQPTHKPGVIYLSRIPPFMRPSTVKTLLSTHGPISKVFLTPEPPSAYLRRKKGGGNKKRSFIDGWVEFNRKKHAKQCADAINGRIVGGKKGGWYRDDVWNARYLHGFGWGDLMQSVRAEEREREERVRVGTKREGRERGEFLRNLERSKVEATRRAKRRKKEEDKSGKGDEGLRPGKEREEVPMAQEVPDGRGEGKKKRFERTFRQNEVRGIGNGSKQSDQPDEVQRVLSKIF